MTTQELAAWRTKSEATLKKANAEYARLLPLAISCDQEIAETYRHYGRKICGLNHLLNSETRRKIEYAYPTSPDAEKYGFGKSGCWMSSLVRHLTDENGLKPLDTSAFLTREEALADRSEIPLLPISAKWLEGRAPQKATA